LLGATQKAHTRLLTFQRLLRAFAARSFIPRACASKKLSSWADQGVEWRFVQRMWDAFLTHDANSKSGLNVEFIVCFAIALARSLRALLLQSDFAGAMVSHGGRECARAAAAVRVEKRSRRGEPAIKRVCWCCREDAAAAWTCASSRVRACVRARVWC
jgi:hypothetical protein